MDKTSWCNYNGIVDDFDVRRYLEWVTFQELLDKVSPDPNLVKRWNDAVSTEKTKVITVLHNESSKQDSYKVSHFVSRVTSCKFKQSELLQLGLAWLKCGLNYTEVTQKLSDFYLTYGQTKTIM